MDERKSASNKQKDSPSSQMPLVILSCVAAESVGITVSHLVEDTIGAIIAIIRINPKPQEPVRRSAPRFAMAAAKNRISVF